MTFGTSDRTTRQEPPRRRRSARSLLPLAVLLWAAAEVWLMVLVAGAVGGGVVLLLLLAGVVAGGAAVKWAGRRAWNNLAATLRAAAPPGTAGAPDGPPAGEAPRAEGTGVAMLGGLLLMVPGFLSDVAGLLCLFPPTRGLLGAAASRLGRRRGALGGIGGYGDVGGAFQQARMRMPDGKVVPGEVVRDDHGSGTDGDRRDGHDGPPPPLTP